MASSDRAKYLIARLLDAFCRPCRLCTRPATRVFERASTKFSMDSQYCDRHTPSQDPDFQNIEGVDEYKIEGYLADVIRQAEEFLNTDTNARNAR